MWVVKNPIRLYLDSRVATQIAKELYAALRKARPNGIEIPDDPRVPQALLQLQKLKVDGVPVWPRLEMVVTGQTKTLYFKRDLDPTVSRQTRESMEDAGLLIHGDKLEDHL